MHVGSRNSYRLWGIISFDRRIPAWLVNSCVYSKSIPSHGIAVLRLGRGECSHALHQLVHGGSWLRHDFTMATLYEHVHYTTKWHIGDDQLCEMCCIPYSGKFSHGANFRVFRGLVSYREILNTRARIRMRACDRARA